MKLNHKILSVLIAVSAVSGIASAAKAQYYPNRSSYDYNQSYQDYQQRMDASERSHKQFLDTVWY